ncbi:hypothetical protein ABFS82_09G037400 [Erythranthe guttata]
MKSSADKNTSLLHGEDNHHEKLSKFRARNKTIILFFIALTLIIAALIFHLVRNIRSRHSDPYTIPVFKLPSSDTRNTNLVRYRKFVREFHSDVAGDNWRNMISDNMFIKSMCGLQLVFIFFLYWTLFRFG